MYTVDGDDRVIKLQDVPQSDVGAPAPIVLADEQTTLLGYVIQGTPYPFDGRVLTDADLQIFAQQLALIEFSLSHSYMFGAPNDEALCGHPLASRGLEAYGAFEIENSSWIRQLEERNSVHPSHRGGWLQRLKHFIFAFHDSTFECVARSLSASQHSSFESLLTEMTKRLNWDRT